MTTTEAPQLRRIALERRRILGASGTRAAFGIRDGNGIQPMLTDGKNGLFTSVVADALRGKADTEGYEPDGVVTTDELLK